MSILQWLGSTASALLAIYGLVRFVYRPIRRLVRDANRLLDRIDKAADRQERHAQELRELAGSATMLAVRREQQIVDLSGRIRDLAELLLDQASEIRHLKEFVHYGS